MLTTSHIHPHLEASLTRAIMTHCYADLLWRQELCRCVPELVELLVETHDHPVEEIAHAIRTLILEHCELIDEAGDASWHCDPADLEQAIEVVTAEMERLRRAEVCNGEWSDKAVPPLMYG